MIYSLLLKEWLKLRWYFITMIVVNFGICVRIFFDIREHIHSEHSEMVWYQAIHIHTVMYQDIRYLPLITGLVLALSQFIPEMLGRRMRIALHLPLGRNRMLFFCLLSGILLYLGVCLLDNGLIFLILRVYFPIEVANSSFATMAPWMIAGLIGYLGIVSVLLESHWPRRVFLFLVFSILVTMMFSGSGDGWFTPALPFLICLVPPALLSVFESGRRFQQRGAQ